jgi:hypothetical protein
MRRRARSILLRLPGGFGYRMARALRLQRGLERGFEPPEQNGSGTAPLTVEMEDEGRRKRLRVRAAGDIWSEDFRTELAADRRFEAGLVWRELIILGFIAAVLAARAIFG